MKFASPGCPSVTVRSKKLLYSGTLKNVVVGLILIIANVRRPILGIEGEAIPSLTIAYQSDEGDHESIVISAKCTPPVERAGPLIKSRQK